jgi:hypothetical protein
MGVVAANHIYISGVLIYGSSRIRMSALFAGLFGLTLLLLTLLPLLRLLLLPLLLQQPMNIYLSVKLYPYYSLGYCYSIK